MFCVSLNGSENCMSTEIMILAIVLELAFYILLIIFGKSMFSKAWEFCKKLFTNKL
jgi:hypothetical protein